MSITMGRSADDRNYQVYLDLDKRRLANQYVVVAGGEVIGTGKDVERYLKQARKRYPRDVPFVAVVPDLRHARVF